MDIKIIFLISCIQVELSQSSIEDKKSRSSRPASRSRARINIGSRFTSSSGSTSSSRFGLTRKNGPRTQSFNYGGFSGSRYGTAIRRSIFWPVRRVVYGTNYSPNVIPTFSNTDILSSIVISDTFIKIKPDENSSTYDCVAPGRPTITCFETLVDEGEIQNEIGQTDIEFYDGGCCENLLTNQAVCCVIGINDGDSKSTILKHIFASSICLIISALLLVRRCR